MNKPQESEIAIFTAIIDRAKVIAHERYKTVSLIGISEKGVDFEVEETSGIGTVCTETITIVWEDL